MPMALADYPLTSEKKSKRKEEIDIINIRYSAVDKLDGISIFARCKLLDLTHLFSRCSVPILGFYCFPALL